MLSSLKNWIWSDKKKNESSEEVIIPVSPGKNTDESPDAIKAEAREEGVVYKIYLMFIELFSL